MKKIEYYISEIERNIRDPRKGLPEEVFLFISRITPLVNVDLLIKDERNRTLLSWRNDEYAGEGWHIPGGIVRFKETLLQRLVKVAQKEIGTRVEFDREPIKMTEVVDYNTETRGHAFSFLYRCYLSSSFIPENKGLTKKSVGYLKWHNGCPQNLIKLHEMYRPYIQNEKLQSL